jgi:hypothetical protein
MSITQRVHEKNFSKLLMFEQALIDFRVIRLTAKPVPLSSYAFLPPQVSATKSKVKQNQTSYTQVSVNFTMIFLTKRRRKLDKVAEFQENNIVLM